MQPDASTGPSAPPTRPHSHAVGTSRGSCSTLTPSGPATSGSQPVQSKSGNAVDAVDESSTASPLSAWFATAVAGQKPAASGYSPLRPAQELDELAALDRVRAARVGPAAPVAVEQARASAARRRRRRR